MTFWEIRNISEVVKQSHLKLYMCEIHDFLQTKSTLLVDLPTRPFVRDMLLVTLTVIYHIHDKSARLNKAQPNYYSTGKRW